jgi:hypothetical protein
LSATNSANWYLIQDNHQRQRKDLPVNPYFNPPCQRLKRSNRFIKIYNYIYLNI